MGDTQKKQVPLRLSAKLYDAIAAWAEDDFRSVNGQSSAFRNIPLCKFVHGTSRTTFPTEEINLLPAHRKTFRKPALKRLFIEM